MRSVKRKFVTPGFPIRNAVNAAKTYNPFTLQGCMQNEYDPFSLNFIENIRICDIEVTLSCLGEHQLSVFNTTIKSFANVNGLRSK